LATVAVILHTTLLYLWDIVIRKQIKTAFVVGLCDLHFVPRVRRGSYKKKGQHEFAIHLNFRTYTGCPKRNVKYFGRVFLMLNYIDITQNTYIQS